MYGDVEGGHGFMDMGDNSEVSDGGVNLRQTHQIINGLLLFES